MRVMHSRADSIDALSQAATLSTFFGPVSRVDRTPLKTIGFTGAIHERWRVSLDSGEIVCTVAKRVRPSKDWISCRTGDMQGREACFLGEPALNAVWDLFECPYIAFATETDDALLLMHDLSPHLVPDVREPIAREQEDRLVSALAALHARFWESPMLDLPWLTSPRMLGGLLDARTAADRTALATLPELLRSNVERGWTAALKHLPDRLAVALSVPADDLPGLPRTLLHGDVKVANFAFPPNSRVAAFDWAMLGAGPATIDIGWYLAVNGSRLTRSKDDLLKFYRSNLEAQLKTHLTTETWNALEKAGIVIGARMLLWSKALALEAGRAGADDEWQWWVARLDASL
jgi:phosphotransferase family enzyme